MLELSQEDKELIRSYFEEDFEKAYTRQDKIGYGTTSTVYRGINNATKEVVAIKQIQVKDANEARTVIHEFNALKYLKHPNIVEAKEIFINERSGKI